MDKINQFLHVKFLGTQVPYDIAMKKMYDIADLVQNDKSHQTLLLLEHKDTITTTKQHGAKNLLANEKHLQASNIELHQASRGGDITFHGTGQLVGYLILKNQYKVLNYVRTLEKSLINTCRQLGLNNSHRQEKFTGVWVNEMCPKKLIAIGVGVRKGVTRHGFAFNIFTDLAKFNELMIPCGIDNYGITSLVDELNKKNLVLPSVDFIFKTVVQNIAQCFNLTAIYENSFKPSLTKLSTNKSINNHFTNSSSNFFEFLGENNGTKHNYASNG